METKMKKNLYDTLREIEQKKTRELKFRKRPGKKDLKLIDKFFHELTLWRGFWGLCAMYCRNNTDSISQRLTEFKEKGANANEIVAALILPHLKWKEKTGMFDMRVNPGKGNRKYEKAIKSALRLLESESPPVFQHSPPGQDINAKIAQMQTEIKELHKRYGGTLQVYFDLRVLNSYYESLREFYPNYPQDSVPPDPRIVHTILPLDRISDMRKKRLKPPGTSTHGLWNESLMAIAAELNKAGYSLTEADREAENLLMLMYPDNYKSDEYSKETTSSSYARGKSRRRRILAKIQS